MGFMGPESKDFVEDAVFEEIVKLPTIKRNETTERKFSKK